MERQVGVADAHEVGFDVLQAFLPELGVVGEVLVQGIVRGAVDEEEGQIAQADVAGNGHAGQKSHLDMA